MTAFYNEIDPYAAEWLRRLIAAGLIAPGVVDTRSIEDITPNELKGFKQVHFFAGIGIWSYALRSAGWPDDRPVWTGSCPCQPFSAAGKGSGFADERHLWPAFFHLIQQCRPGVVFGEQVASSDGLKWWDVVQNDLENQGMRSAALDLCAAGFGAPHIRQRLYWVADSNGQQHKDGHQRSGKDNFAHGEGTATKPSGLRGVIGLDNSGSIGFNAGRDGHNTGYDWKQPAANGTNERLANSGDTGSQGRLSGRADSQREDQHGYAGRSSPDSGMGHAYGAECQTWELVTGGGSTPPDQLTQSSLYRGVDNAHGGKFGAERSGSGEAQAGTGIDGANEPIAGESGGNELALLPQFTHSLNGFWRSADWLYCKDGKFRPVEPGTFPLANGASPRLVCACSECGSETVIYENVLALRKADFGEGCEAPEILRSKVLSIISAINAVNEPEYGALQSANDETKDLREMFSYSEFASASQGSQSLKRCAGESGNALQQMPSRSSSTRAAAFEVRRLWKDFSGGIKPEGKQNLFCPVCENMGAHQCYEEMGAGRVGRLRAYGNAIVAPVAENFIRTYMEAANDEQY